MGRISACTSSRRPVIDSRQQNFEIIASVIGAAGELERNEDAELLICRGLSTLLARGYPAEDLCYTYRVTPAQLSRVATVPAFSSTFKLLAASR